MNASSGEERGNDDVAERYNAVAEEYDERFQSGYLTDIQNETVFSVLNQLLNRTGMRVLDAGGGTGFYSLPLAAKGHEVVILDKSKNMLKIAKTKSESLRVENRVRIVIGDMENIKEPPESFDVVLCHLALCHAASPPKALAQFNKVLVKHGILSLIVENKIFFSLCEAFKGNIAEALKRLKQENLVISFSSLGKLKTFERRELLTLLEQNGFKPLRVLSLRVLSDYLSYVQKGPPKELPALQVLESFLSQSPELNSIGRFHFAVSEKR